MAKTPIPCDPVGDSQRSGSPEASSFTCCGTAEEVIASLKAWTDGRSDGTPDKCSPREVEAKVDTEPSLLNIELLKLACAKRCECQDIGQDGTNGHTPFSFAQDGVQIFQHPDSLATLPVCMNHHKCYIRSGWKFVSRTTALANNAKLCQYCCSRERFRDPKTGFLDIFCEECINENGAAMGARHKRVVQFSSGGNGNASGQQPSSNDPKFNPTLRSTRCLNINQGVTGCTIWALPGKDLCAFCDRQKLLAQILPEAEKRATPPKCRVQTIHADRPCNLTKGCKGTMHATIRTYVTGEGCLWWFCEKCHQQRIAELTQATVDPRAKPAITEAEENKRIHDALNTFDSEAREQGAHIKSIIKEGRLD